VRALQFITQNRYRSRITVSRVSVIPRGGRRRTRTSIKSNIYGTEGPKDSSAAAVAPAKYRRTFVGSPRLRRELRCLGMTDERSD